MALKAPYCTAAEMARKRVVQKPRAQTPNASRSGQPKATPEPKGGGKKRSSNW